MCELKQKIEASFDLLRDPSLLFLRLILAYGFFEPAMNKWSDIDAVASWFRDGLGLPMPLLSAYMAASTEIVGVALLTLGLFVRFISIPLIIVMIVAITTVHLQNGFSAADNGFEIPFYYMLMLIVLLAHGGGKIGIDYFISKNKNC